jgi:hypothetical protein
MHKKKKVNLICNCPQLIEITFKDPVPIAKKTQYFTITKINCLTTFKEIITAYSENLMKCINTLCSENYKLLIVKAGGTFSYQRSLKA